MWRSHPFLFLVGVLGLFSWANSQKPSEVSLPDLKLKYVFSQRLGEALILAQDSFLKTKFLLGIEILDPKPEGDEKTLESTRLKSFSVEYFFLENLLADRETIPSNELEGQKLKQICELKTDNKTSTEKWDCKVENQNQTEKFKFQFPISPSHWHIEAILLSFENFLHLFEQFSNPANEEVEETPFEKKITFINKIKLWHSASKTEKGMEADVQGKLLWKTPEMEKTIHQAFWCHDHDGKQWDCHRLRRPGPFEPRFEDPKKESDGK